MFRLLFAATLAAPLALPVVADEIGADFSLTSTDGRRIGPEQLRGKPYLLFFGFTHCPEVCPVTLSELSMRLEELGPDSDRLVPIFVTVDPARDTPEFLREYLGFFDTRIIGLAGTEAETQTAARSFRATYRKVPLKDGGYTMDHTAVTYLMDAQGRFFDRIDYRDDPATQLRALKRLLNDDLQAAYP